MTQEIEFERPKEEWVRSADEDVNDFVKITKVLTKILGWKLTRRIDVDCLLFEFEKNNIEIRLVYDEMAGMYLKTEEEQFPLQELFDEINGILKSGKPL